MNLTHLAFFLTTSLCLMASALEPYSGQIQIKSGKPFILLSTKESLSLESEDLDLKQTLEKLRSGDIISGLGFRENLSVKMESINFIGLKQLIGTWKGKETYVFIPSFSEMRVFGPAKIANSKMMKLMNLQNYTYSVYPSSNTGFNLFLTNESDTIIGDLEVKSQVLTIRLLNGDTGEISQVYKFSRLN